MSCILGDTGCTYSSTCFKHTFCSPVFTSTVKQNTDTPEHYTYLSQTQNIPYQIPYANHQPTAYFVFWNETLMQY